MASIEQSETPQKSLTSRAITAGVYIAGVGIALNVVYYLAGLNESLMTNAALKWLNNLVLFGINFFFIYKAAQQHRDIDKGGYLNVGGGIGLGTLAGLVTGIISAFWVAIFMGFIAPEMIDQIKEVAMAEMEKSGQSEEQIEQAMKYASFFFSPTFFAIATLFFSTFFGFLAGLLSGLILKKERPL